MSLQMQTDRLMAALARAQQHGELERMPPPPALTIAVSREAGANSGEVAKAIGARLGWPVYDRELVQMVADNLKVRARLVEDLDERRSNWVRDCMESFGAGYHVTHGAYVHRLIETLLLLAVHGKCVLVGRGAALVLPGDTTLRVRLVARRERRIQEIEKRRKLSWDEAERWVDATDRERRAFLREYHGADPAQPKYCDLQLNTETFSVAECAEIVCTALKRMQDRATANAVGAR